MVNEKGLKQRAIYVYPPTHMAEKWKKLARESGTSISKFVMEHVENSLNVNGEGDTSRSSLLHENQYLRDSLGERDKRVGHLELLVEKLEEDLLYYRSKMFTDPGFSGVRQYDRRLVEVLREPGTHSNDEIFARLRIRPTESESVKAVLVQLENLESYGLVKASGKGWTWKE